MNALLLAVALASAPQPPHVELSFGFVGGYRNLTQLGFAYEDGASAAQSLSAPFSQAPYTGVPVYGVGVETRVVARYLRFTAGVQKPFATFRLSDDSGVSTRALSFWDFRFGLGAEYAFEHAAPFVDLVGDMQLVDAALTVNNQAADYRAFAFGFSARAGVRIQLGEYLFISPCAEVGLGGAQRFGASLMAGWTIPA